MFLSITTLALAGALDGKTFTATVTDPQKKVLPDTLVFANDGFSSSECEKAGFHTSPYAVAADGTVTADQTSATEGKNHWVLKVTGDKVEGSLDWTKVGQAPIHYVVSGTIKK